MVGSLGALLGCKNLEGWDLTKLYGTQERAFVWTHGWCIMGICEVVYDVFWGVLVLWGNIVGMIIVMACVMLVFCWQQQHKLSVATPQYPHHPTIHDLGIIPTIHQPGICVDACVYIISPGASRTQHYLFPPSGDQLPYIFF